MTADGANTLRASFTAATIARQADTLSALKSSKSSRLGAGSFTFRVEPEQYGIELGFIRAIRLTVLGAVASWRAGKTGDTAVSAWEMLPGPSTGHAEPPL